VSECKPLAIGDAGDSSPMFDLTIIAAMKYPVAGAYTRPLFRAQLENLRDTSLTLELNLSTFGTH